MIIIRSPDGLILAELEFPIVNKTVNLSANELRDLIRWLNFNQHDFMVWCLE